jgi:hypothetical protein
MLRQVVQLDLLAACFLPDLFFEPGEEGGTSLRKGVKLLPDYTALHFRREYVSTLTLVVLQTKVLRVRMLSRVLVSCRRGLDW